MKLTVDGYMAKVKSTFKESIDAEIKPALMLNGRLQ